MQLVA